MQAGQHRKRASRDKGEGPGTYDRGRSAEERRAEQRTRLLMAAIEVFAREGYARASVDAIVERARMSRRTYYEHFADLSDALLQVLDFAASFLLHRVEDAVREHSDPLLQLEAGIRAYLLTFQEHADLVRVMNREIRAAGPKHVMRYELAVLRFVTLISQGVTLAYARGIASRPPDETTVYALVAGLEAVGMRYVDRGEESRIMEAAPLLAELVLRAFR